MAKIIYVRRIAQINRDLKNQAKKIVLVGGCFDILHPGHVVFLEKAKKAGDILVVMLESDQKIKEIKGINRPVHSQSERAQILSSLKYIDYILMLPYLESDTKYDDLVAKIKPSVIAATAKDENLNHLQRSARLVDAKLKLVTKVIGNYSTSSLIKSVTVQ